MNKRKSKLLIAIAIICIITLIYFLRGLKSQTFADANGVYPPYNEYYIDELYVYSEKSDVMTPIDHIRVDDIRTLTKLMNTTKVSGNDIREPFFKSRIVEQKFHTTSGANLSFNIYRFYNNYYVAFPTDHLSGDIAWYKLKSKELPDFYFDLLEKEVGFVPVSL